MSGVGNDLPRQLRLFPATNIVIADMIGAGIFTTSGLLLLELGSPMLMISLWACGGILALSGALCYGALGAAMPRAGGEYAYLSQQFHPMLGFLSGWVSFFVGFSAPLAASSLGFSEYLGSAFPALAPAGSAQLAKKAIALGVILALASVHLRGTEVGSRVQNFLTVGKVLLIAGLIVAGFTFGQGDLGNLDCGGRPQNELEGHRSLPDVDHVCVQRLECVGVFGLGNPVAAQKSATFTHTRHRRCTRALRKPECPLRVRHITK